MIWRFNRMKFCVSNKWTATKPFFSVVLAILLMLYEVAPFCWVCGWNPNDIQPSSEILWYCLSCVYEVVLTLESVNKIGKCDIQMEAFEPYIAVVFMIIL